MITTACPGARTLPALAAAAVLALLCGCSVSHTVTGGADPATKADAQSETAATVAKVGNQLRLVVAYNDWTGQAAKIKFPDENSRLVVAGASQMGWSFSDDLGKTWTHGGPLSPPNGFSVLWSDPAIATSGAKGNLVFISALAVPDAKMPAGGINGGFQSGPMDSPIGGACIARSTDAGKSFVHWHCMQNTDPIAAVPGAANGHFYDGASMASTPAGEVFAAYDDVPAGRIDVWRAPDENGAFKRLADPFPGKVAASHPRMKVGPDGVLYLAARMALDENGNTAVFMTRLVAGAWTPAVQVGQPAFLPGGLDLGSMVLGSKLTIRTAVDFGFDVGTSSAGGGDAVRLVDVHVSNGRRFLQGGACAADLSGCQVFQGWQLGPSSPGATPLDLYGPEVVAWKGDAAHPASWQVSFMERFRASTTTVNVSRSTLGFVNGSPLVFPVNIAKQVPVCSDRRGYWGDYDAMILTGPGKSGMNWMRFFTDASSGCTQRWQFVAHDQHISQASYDY